MLPEQFTERMKQMLSGEYEEFLQSFENEQYRSLRINPLKGTKEQYDKTTVFDGRPVLTEQVAWAADGYYYEEWLKPGRHPFHEAGVYYIQEASAMLPAAVCAAASPHYGDITDQNTNMPKEQQEWTEQRALQEESSSAGQSFEGERVLDLCAAPGGKSTQMAAAMRGKGILFSNEIHPARAKILSENIERMGISNAVVFNHDPQQLAEQFPQYFHRILVDAPCSGEGMFRKNEEAVAQWSEENVQMCAERQEEILEAAYRMLMEGGILVYSTCTFATLEDELMISRFLKAHEDMKLIAIPLKDGMTGGQSYGQPEVAADIGKTVRLWPHKLKGEGHYTALLQKTGEAIHPVIQQEKNRLPKELLKSFEEFEAQTLKESWRNGKEAYRYLLFGEQLYLTPPGMPELRGLRVLRPGLHLGTFKKNRFEPSHALALHLKKEDVKESIDLSSEDAVKYIQGYTFPAGDRKGWCLVTAEGYSLGFGKAAGGTLKNHYPKGLRKTW